MIHDNRKPKAYYVASLSTYVVVSARSADEAMAKGEIQLAAPVRVVRPATTDEIDLAQSHARMIGDWKDRKDN